MIMRNEAPMPSASDAKQFVQLQPTFLIPTFACDCNSDSVILKQEDWQQRNYMICETKSNAIEELLHPTEVAEIKCGKKHFAAIVIDDYAKASPLSWRLHQHE